MIDQSKRDAIVSILKQVELNFDEVQSSIIDGVVESQLVGKPRDKALKGTKSWSTNCLIRFYHSSDQLKSKVKFPEYL